ncbi:MAG: amino acid adenylation domain-containing protein [Planctomycetota bacterium]
MHFNPTDGRVETLATSNAPVAVLDSIDTVSPTTVIDLIAGQASRTPNALAIVCETERITYGELWDRVSTLSIGVRDRIGAVDSERAPVFVGLCFDRSADAIISMLAIMHAGYAFVPIDPEYPVERMADILADAPASCVLTDKSNGLRVQRAVDHVKAGYAARLETVQLDGLLAAAESTPRPDTHHHAVVDGYAYVMYTSGSTGRPKGVAIDHRALFTYCIADKEVYQLQVEDRTLQFSTLCFDIAVEEIFPPLVMGSSVVIRPSDRAASANELSEIIDRFDVTALHLATAYWHNWVDLMVATHQRVPESLRLMVVTGEKVSMEHYRRWQSLCHHPVLWCNAYGPTEATVSATVFVPEPGFDQEVMPIGKPLPGYEAFILDEEGRPVSGVETGQLFLAGPALAREYLHRPDITEDAFQTKLIEGRRVRTYATGDLARWLPDGNIDFAGRIDHQIKLGSYRIEPGEIEAALQLHTKVLQCLIGVSESRGIKSLHAYFSSDECEEGHAALVDDVASFLGERLPTYMVPQRYVVLKELPTTLNGKVDRKSLPSPEEGLTPGGADYTAPVTELQKQLCELWQEILQIKRIGIHDDFFLLGGSSLLVTQLIARLSGLEKVELPVRDFFANPTVAALAAHLVRLQGGSHEGDHKRMVGLRRATLPKVEPCFFGSDIPRYGVIHHSRMPSRQHAVVIAGGIGHEGTRSHRNLQQLSILLTQHGFDVIRFDYRGSGNSSGEPNATTWRAMWHDTLDAARHLMASTDAESWSLIGKRIGGSVIATGLATDTEPFPVGRLPQRVILWDPIVSGAAWLAMLQDFHKRVLKDFSRFPVRRSEVEPLEVLGMPLPIERQTSWKELNLNGVEPPPQTQLLWSAGNKDAELLEWHANAHQLPDTLAWGQLQHITSAYACPHSYNSILELLCQDDRTGVQSDA